ncbi:MAG: 1-acyl-sn-glycerol-3-phosphate acyltransferase [Deltaproteobacteria bacterium]|nr:1-acyl-sn-glycerol-3-phosphate acyltransferase [Deltaproteobacteria bacterium]
MAASPRPRKKSLTKKFSRSFSRNVVKTANRIDFIKLLHRIADSESGQPWAERFADMPPSWPEELQERIIQTARELTLTQLAAEGEPGNPAQVAKFVDQIRCRYELEILRTAAVAVMTVYNGLFDSPDPVRPFTSPDGRDTAHLELLRQYQAQGLGVVYLVNHSSHMDEFLTDGVLLNNDLPLPLFAAGDNMMAVGSLAKVLINGSYVVQRRGASRQALASLYNYCRAISECGGTQGIFLEAWHGGARSRDGSLRYPRRLVTLRGALDVSGDVVVQPVAVSYSVVPEDLPLADRKGARAWVRGIGFWKSLATALIHPRSWVWRRVQNLYGRAFVSFPRPWLLSELKEAHTQDKGGRSLDEFVALTAIRDIAGAKKVMASQLVARGLVRARRLESGKVDLAALVDDETKRLREYHRATFGHDPDLEDFLHQHTLTEVVADGLATLKRRGVLYRFKKDLHRLPEVKNQAGLAFYATHGDRRIYSPTADQNIVVVGGGDWGFAFACAVGNRILEEKRYLNASLTLYDSRPEVATELNLHRNHPGRFEDHLLPKNVFVTSDSTAAFRKASEVILAVGPDDVAKFLVEILATCEQKVKLVVATRGFDAKSHKLPISLARDLAARHGRQDVELFSLVGAVKDVDLVEGNPTIGILAGDGPSLTQLADLFKWPPLEVVTQKDPVGVMAADTLARVYALWGQFLFGRQDIQTPAQTGWYMARAGAEVQRLGLALGARPETFTLAGPAWAVTFASAGLGGVSRDFGRRLGSQAKKGKDAAAGAAKLHQQMEANRMRPQPYLDLKTAHTAAQALGLDLPILNEAYKTLWEGGE